MRAWSISNQGSFIANEYLYDANGNLFKDMNKQISHIDYSVQNLRGSDCHRSECLPGFVFLISVHDFSS